MKKLGRGVMHVFLLTMMMQGCKLTDVTDLKPENKLDESSVVTDIPSAEKLLAGAYYTLRMDDMAGSIPYHTSLMGLNVSSVDPANAPYLNNTVMPDNEVLNGKIYDAPYEMIQTANWVIEKTGA